MERDELVEHVAAVVRRALHAAYHMNADPYEDDPLRFGVSFPGGFVEVVVALSGEPAPTEPRRKFTDHGAFDPWHEED